MNTFKKIYCRIYQQIFHVAIPFLPYRKPKIIYTVMAIPNLLDKKNIKKVMLITDKSIRSFGLTAPLEEILKDNEIECIVYDETVANPTTNNVEDALVKYHENNCQALIGFGGGSSIDCAKAVGARVANPHKSLGKMAGILKVRHRLPLLIAVPTTAGTGSETTLAAVIVDSDTRHKYPINDFPLIPHYAVLDPQVTKSLPPFLTATTGMDALTHAVEAYIGHSTTYGTRKDSIRAIKLIFKYIRQAYNNGNDMKARKQMLYASYLAGSAFTKSYVGYVHAVAHSLGGKYNTPHGLANAVLLPHVLRSYGNKASKKLFHLAKECNLVSESDSISSGADKFIKAIETLQKDLNIPVSLPDIQKQDIPEMAKYAQKEANPLYPVPKLMSARELEQFYYKIME